MGLRKPVLLLKAVETAMEKHSTREKLLSIVIISKDEECNIRRCIESVLSAIAPLNNVEVILVDSASTDATVDIAQEYPIRILQLNNSVRLRPAAGRHVGFQNSNGEHVFFLDGDSFVHKDWFVNALPYFYKDKRIGVLLGKRRETYVDESFSNSECTDSYGIHSEAKEFIPFLSNIGGSGLYRSSTLQDVGGFNPFIFSYEEAELCYRIYKAGYKILGIPYEMITHSGEKRETAKALLRRMSRNFHVGQGQILRYALKNRILEMAHFRNLSMVFLFMVCLFLGLLSVGVFLISQEDIFLYAWFGMMLALFLTWSVRSKQLWKPIFYIFFLSLESWGLIRGFLMKPLDPDSYPTDLKVIK